MDVQSTRRSSGAAVRGWPGWRASFPDLHTPGRHSAWAVGSTRGTRLSWGRSRGQPALTMAMPVFWWCPTPPSTARTMRMYSDLASRSSRDVVVISPAARGDERDGGRCMVASYPGLGEQQHRWKRGCAKMETGGVLEGVYRHHPVNI